MSASSRSSFSLGLKLGGDVMAAERAGGGQLEPVGEQGGHGMSLVDGILTGGRPRHRRHDKHGPG